jgi:hypothetical protein
LIPGTELQYTLPFEDPTTLWSYEGAPAVNRLIKSFSLLSAPTVSLITPNPVTTTQATWITVNGTGFQSNFSATVAGYHIAAAGLQFISSTQVKVNVSMGAGSYSATVVITNPDGGSAGDSFQVNTTPAPSISGLSPSSYPASGSSQTMLINGSNFQSGATLTFHDPQGSPYAGRATTFISSSQLSNPFNNGNDAGTWTVFVTNPSGQTSNTWTFTVTAAPAPSISGLSPNWYPTSSSAQTMLINGSNFQSGATLTFHDPQGNPYAGRATTFVSSNQLSHPFNNSNDAGTWKVFVTNPDGRASSTWSFTVSPPTGVVPADLSLQ